MRDATAAGGDGQHSFTTIEDVAVYLPRRTISVEDSVLGFGLSRPQTRMLRRMHGFGDLHVEPDLDLFELLLAAARELLRSVADHTTIRYLIFAHTVPTITPSHLQAPELLRDRLGLDHAEPFAIGQQHCAGSLSALDIAGQLLRALGDPTARALLVTGEKRLSSLVRLLRYSTAIGEASTACLLGVGGGGDRLLSYADRTVGLRHNGNWLSDEASNEFMYRYPDDLADVVTEALHGADLCMSDIALVIPHNVSRMLWYRTIAALGIERHRVHLDTIDQYGHCYCSDPFLNLVALRRAGRLRAGSHYLLTSVGLGATHAAAVIEHQPGVALPRRRSGSAHG